MTVSTPPTRAVTPTAHCSTTYRVQLPAIMATAFVLSVVHTGYAWVAGIEDPTFTVTSPLAWIFYLVAFTITALARREARWAQLVVLGFLVLCLVIGIFYYPTMFQGAQQTVFGWFENDVYLGLLGIACYLGVLRLRGCSLVVHR